MNRGFSIYLDALRFLAAFFVVMTHLAYPRFAGDALLALRSWDYGRDAVIIFFVLSGLVIAYVAERDGSGARFAFNRATRLYSVLVPALLATFLLDQMGRLMAPEAYAGWWYADMPTFDFFVRGLTFSNEWALGAVRLGTNGPLWSLSYEAAYYLLFGLAVFGKGRARWVLLVLAAVIAGPRALLLMPAWACGLLAWRMIKYQADTMPTAPAFGAALALPVFYTVAHASGLPSLLTSMGAPLGRLVALRFSDAFLWDNLLALFVMLHLVGMARLVRAWNPGAIGRAIRWLAGASFTLYVLHYPLLQFIHQILPGQMPVRLAALLVLTVGSCIAVAAATERRLGAFRLLCQRLAGRRKPAILSN